MLSVLGCSMCENVECFGMQDVWKCWVFWNAGCVKMLMSVIHFFWHLQYPMISRMCRDVDNVRALYKLYLLLSKKIPFKRQWFCKLVSFLLMAWCGPWPVIKPWTSPTRRQHSTTRLSRRRIEESNMFLLLPMIYYGILILYENIDQTLVNSLHKLLNREIGGLDCHVITTEYRTRVHCIHM